VRPDCGLIDRSAKPPLGRPAVPGRSRLVDNRPPPGRSAGWSARPVASCWTSVGSAS